ncbi:hypothetical protein DSM104443_01160 [Usitatibacter rugosus]|uniref:Uncharacterized protein n=1 Tax=Usitatibacter rugosus TaxID=2732067 RepID=A0A6M4GWZ5_9PROT|nr:hypothetical protein [Usitatibacter rugosus]QJR10107.1 hypothetical protein DSM104443_01160 [Usitatibacter rugosus]
MRALHVVFPTQTRTASPGLVERLAKDARERAAALAEEHDPEKLTASSVAVCDVLADAIRAARGSDRMLDVLQNIRRAFDGEEFDGDHEAIRAARYLRRALQAVHGVAPEFETPDVSEFRGELALGIARLDAANKSAWSRIIGAGQVVGWHLPRAVQKCDDVGLVVRAMRRAGLLPRELDPRLCYGPVGDPRADEATPARNAAHAIDVLRRLEPIRNMERHAEGERVGQDIAARVRAIVEMEHEENAA